MRTTRGVVNISVSLPSFLGLEGTACQGLVALVAPDFIIRRQTADAAEEVLLPLLDSNLFNLVLVLLTGIYQTGNIFAHATESGSHCGHLDFGNRYSSNEGNRKTSSFPMSLLHRLVDEKYTPFQRLHFIIGRGRVPCLVDMHLLLSQVIMCPP